jgi:putative oxygen-independent coproporphyrinogen III oxidase
MRYGVYVHLPWCRTRCHYCSFNVHVSSRPPHEAYTRALLRQWEQLRPEGAPATLYFGGGTPSLHPPDQLEQIIQAIGAPRVEMEANPEDLAQAPEWARAGVTRLSVGAQTFDPARIRFLNRIHRAEALAERLSPLAGLFESWSADLIFGLPNQTLDELHIDLHRLLGTNPPHVALYGLTAHPGTGFARAIDRGLYRLDDEQQGEMLEHIVARLQEAGLPRYEVSNFARPGHRSLHNEGVWQGHPYIGLGAGAHGLLPDGRRTIGVADPASFIAEGGMSFELPDPRQRAMDHVISAMRHIDGVDPRALKELGFVVDPGPLKPHLDRGTLAVDPSIRLVGEGWMYGDRLIATVAMALLPLT